MIDIDTYKLEKLIKTCAIKIESIQSFDDGVIRLTLCAKPNK